METIIREQYVSFETAKMLKEAGFNGECQAFYHRAKNGRRNLYMFATTCYLDLPNEYLAPTQAVVTRWLREMYNVHVQISVYKSFYDDIDQVIWRYDLLK